MHCPKPTLEVHAFLSLVGHYQQFIKGFAHITQLLNKNLIGEGASRKLEWVSLLEDTLKSFWHSETGMYDCPHLSFCTDYTKEFLLETDVSNKCAGGQWCPKSRQKGNTTRSPIVAELLWLMRKTTIPPKLEFLALKWAFYRTLSKSTSCINPSWWRPIIIL